MFQSKKYLEDHQFISQIIGYIAEAWHMGSGVIIETAIPIALMVFALLIVSVMWVLYKF